MSRTLHAPCAALTGPRTRFGAALTLLSTFLPAVARAEFAEPPPAPYAPAPPPAVDDGYEQNAVLVALEAPLSSFRLGVGPVATIAKDELEAGLATALDVGRGRAGLRLGAAWSRSLDASSASTATALYSAELVLDLGSDGPWRPLIAAGAGLAILSRANDAEESTSQSVGVGILRGAIHYTLPITGTDARASVDFVGVVPAVGSTRGPAAPWGMATAGVVVGF